jgi:hypothetical protein
MARDQAFLPGSEKPGGQRRIHQMMRRPLPNAYLFDKSSSRRLISRRAWYERCRNAKNPDARGVVCRVLPGHRLRTKHADESAGTDSTSHADTAATSDYRSWHPSAGPVRSQRPQQPALGLSWSSCATQPVVTKLGDISVKLALGPPAHLGDAGSGNKRRS